MQSEPGRYINSVSDLYGTDEIEFLLDDIRDLEPASCKPEDIQGDAMTPLNGVLQDFEIAGSRTGADCGGGCECDSPIGTVNSWDSHSHYRHRNAASPDLSLFSGVIVYCDHTHLKSPTGVVRVLLVISTVACLACLCTSGTVKVGLFMLPLVGRLRLMMFVTLLTIFCTSLLLFLDISHVIYLFPFNWGKVNAYLYVSISVLFLISSSLIFHMVFLSDSFSWVPKWTHQQLLVTGCLGYVCCLESVILTIIEKFTATEQYQPVAEDPSLTLHERRSSLQDHNSPDHIIHQLAHNYKPAMAPSATSYPPAVASTSRQVPQQQWPLDDVQPCSSKSADPYRLA